MNRVGKRKGESSRLLVKITGVNQISFFYFLFFFWVELLTGFLVFLYFLCH